MRRRDGGGMGKERDPGSPINNSNSMMAVRRRLADELHCTLNSVARVRLVIEAILRIVSVPLSLTLDTGLAPHCPCPAIRDDSTLNLLSLLRMFKIRLYRYEKASWPVVVKDINKA